MIVTPHPTPMQPPPHHHAHKYTRTEPPPLAALGELLMLKYYQQIIQVGGQGGGAGRRRGGRGGAGEGCVPWSGCLEGVLARTREKGAMAGEWWHLALPGWFAPPAAGPRDVCGGPLWLTGKMPRDAHAGQSDGEEEGEGRSRRVGGDVAMWAEMTAPPKAHTYFTSRPPVRTNPDKPACAHPL